MLGGKKVIAVDLDGTLAYYRGWRGVQDIGEPIPEVARRVHAAMGAGHVIYIFTARAAPGNDIMMAVAYIHAWCQIHFGRQFMVTAIKHREIDEFWDDKAVSIQHNEGNGATHDVNSLWNKLS